MRATLALLTPALALFALTACAGEEAPEPGVVPVEEGSVPAAPAPDPAAPVAGGATLTLGSAPQHGPFVADSVGRALYMLEGHAECYDACAQEWPPYLAPQGTPTAGSAEIQPGMIGTVQRRDGAAQVTYNGHPLFHYHDDQGPGQATGQDVHDQWGAWYLVRPSGEPLEEGGGR